MTPKQLDFIFPFIVFFYGFLVLLVLETPALAKLGREKMADAYDQLSRHGQIAWLSFFVGGLWSLQNIFSI